MPNQKPIAVFKALIRSLPETQIAREMLKTEIFAAINECRKAESVDAFLRQHQVFAAYKYQVLDNSEHFDAKAMLIVGLRAAFPTLDELSVDDLPSNEKWVAEPLRLLGFEVVDKTAAPPTTIRDGLAHVLNKYPIAHTETFEKHSLGSFVRSSLTNAVKTLCDNRLLIKGSVGNGNWAETCWVAIFDPRITKSAQNGVYVVYLFDQAGRHAYLSLNQATTEVYEEYKKQYRQVLEDRAVFARELLSPYNTGDLIKDPLDLTGQGDLTRGYCAGNIVSIKYDTADLPTEADLVRDLNRILNLYATYVAVKNGEVGESEELPDNISSGQEAKKYRWHRRAERNQKLAADAKKFHGSTCKVCGFNFEQKYGERGKGYIEAHHIVPFADLVKEPEPVTLDPKTDFVVVCANCHRMLHRTKPAMLPDQLKRILEIVLNQHLN